MFQSNFTSLEEFNLIHSQLTNIHTNAYPNIINHEINFSKILKGNQFKFFFLVVVNFICPSVFKIGHNDPNEALTGFIVHEYIQVP
jgi:hypothetical protein